MTIAGRGRLIKATLAMAAFLGASLAQTGGAAAAGGRWVAEPVPYPQGYLADITHLDAHTTWAVGSRESTVDPYHPVLVGKDDRDGQGWKVIPTPDDGQDHTWYRNLDASSTRDVWAVGGALSGTSVPAVHWDGSTWRSADIPVPENSNVDMRVATVSPTDAWAAGWYSDPDTQISSPLLRHWDGTAWNAVPVPADADVMNLMAIEATPAHDVWVTGFSDTDQPRALHYDGTGWTPAAIPFTGVNGELYDIAANGPGDVYAVGRTLLDEKDWGHSLVMHYDGTAWHQVAAPAKAGQLISLARTADGGIVAVGQDVDRTESIVLKSTTAGLSMRALPSVNGVAPYVDGVDATARGTVTVIGMAGDTAGDPPAPLALTGSL
ncbi:DUF2510 domain-containing protein [Streptomyces cocklensis]|uniref:DUF2510 domain-containing protein n=1 Tax=Actinacidiphila cocklensis TaxID=887465 RepID=A0A9W4GSU2_9ACTN|nr:DUF2510 domain-containing protein [Actinacidiphila cocklensis]MDD1061323.1 DUF2510 domain-containing protein [Actinacidiphila cocklensis]CAG6395646.1 conserved exported hypothetical protein [Actinacidiphila cocklensis]